MIGKALLFVGAAAAMCAAGLSRTRRESARPVPHSARLAEQSSVLSEALDPTHVMFHVVEHVSALLRVRTAGLYMIDPGSDQIVLKAIHHARSGGLDWARVLPAEAGLAGFCLRHGRAAATPDVLSDRRITVPSQLFGVLEGASQRARLAVPLMARGRASGVLVVADRTGRVFRRNEIDLAAAFASQAALAVENARLFEESQLRRRVAEHLADVGRLLSGSLDPQVVAQAVVGSILALFEARSAVVFRIDAVSGDLIPVAVTGIDAAHMSRVSIAAGTGLAGLAVRARRPVSSSDIHSDPRLVYSGEVISALEASGLGAALVVPLIVQGEVIGALGMGDPPGRLYSAEEIAVAQTFADQAAVALQNARLYQQTRSRLRQTETLLSVSQALGSTLDLSETMRRVAREMGRALKADMAGAYLPSMDGRTLHPFAGYHVPKALRRQFLDCPLPLTGHSFLEEARDRGGPTWTADAPGDPRVDRDLLTRFPLRSILFAPMVAEGQLIGGIFAVWRTEERHFATDELRLVRAIAQQAGSNAMNAKLYWELGRRLSEAEDLGEAVLASNEALQRISGQLLDVQEKERRGLARELHDQMGQILTTLKMSLRIGLREAPPNIAPRLEHADDLVSELLRRIRGMALDLRPALLDDLGLLPALLWHFEQYTATTKVRVIFRQKGLDRRFSPEVETVVYRIVQEALTNVARHSQTDEVEVTAWASGHEVDIQVEDRGLGFDLEEVMRRRPQGISGMYERVTLLGGEFLIDSSRGGGTSVRGRLPIDKTTDPDRPGELAHGDHARPR